MPILNNLAQTNSNMLRLRTRSSSRFARIGKRRRNSYEKMMKTLLLQNQQIIIQQQNMMFMVVKQLQQPLAINNSQPLASPPPQNSNCQHQHSQQQHHHQQHNDNSSSQLQHHHQIQQQQPHQEQQQQIHQITDDHSLQSHDLFNHRSTTMSSSTQQSMDTQQQLQQVANQLQDSLCANYLTPAASEQDPISDKQDDDELVALLEGDGLLHSNMLYNPQTDIGSITPYKSHQPQHQTPSYYSSGCESLTTPRVETQRQPTTTNISQNVVKNLADSFKSPTKPKINVQILSGTATGSMKNSKAKIIQRMNISEFLRHVHPDSDDVPPKIGSQ